MLEVTVSPSNPVFILVMKRVGKALRSFVLDRTIAENTKDTGRLFSCPWPPRRCTLRSHCSPPSTCAPRRWPRCSYASSAAAGSQRGIVVRPQPQGSRPALHTASKACRAAEDGGYESEQPLISSSRMQLLLPLQSRANAFSSIAAPFTPSFALFWSSTSHTPRRLQPTS